MWSLLQTENRSLFWPNLSVPVTLLESALAHAAMAQSAWVLLLTALALLAARRERDVPRGRALVFFAGLHLAGLLVSIALSVAGSTLATTFDVPTWVAGAVAAVAAVGTLLFDWLLPALRVVVPRIVQDVLVALCAVVVGVGVASNAGVNLSGLIATSAVLTAILGFSLQDTIGNIAGGLALQLDTSIEVGDWVRVGTQPNEVNGRVVDIRWRYTAIETRNWETVLVPNRVLMNSQVMVLARRRGQPKYWRRWVHFNVEWKHQPTDVMEVVQAAVRGAQIQGVASEPAPNCILSDMSHTYGSYSVRYWLTDLAHDDPTDSEVRTRIFFALERAGIKLARPLQRVEVAHDSEERNVIKTEKQRARRRALLDSVELFTALAPEERQVLADELKYAPFARGEVITRQGAEAHWLYLIEEGTVSVRLQERDLEREVATMGAHHVFGEMGLLTGAPRSASVYAVTDVECFRLDKASFHRVLQQRPALAQALAGFIESRKANFTAAKESLETEAANRPRQKSNDLSNTILRFFGLG
jgi:small-conductance mechanosensitive channel/CRP-like cAMP-binding protein